MSTVYCLIIIGCLIFSDKSYKNAKKIVKGVTKKVGNAFINISEEE